MVMMGYHLEVMLIDNKSDRAINYAIDYAIGYDNDDIITI